MRLRLTGGAFEFPQSSAPQPITVLFQGHVLKQERYVNMRPAHVNQDEAGRLALSGIGLKNDGSRMNRVILGDSYAHFSWQPVPFVSLVIEKFGHRVAIQCGPRFRHFSELGKWQRPGELSRVAAGTFGKLNLVHSENFAVFAFLRSSRRNRAPYRS